MARSEARISVSIWSDPDFRTLSPGAQWTYMFLLSQPDLAHHGVIPLRDSRWASASKGLTLEKLRADLAELEDGRYVIVDADAQELMVRSLIRGDKIYKQPNLLHSAADNLTVVQSPMLRAAIATEVRRILAECSDIPPGSFAPLRRILDTLGEPMPEGIPDSQVKPSPNPTGKGSRKGSPKGSDNPTPRVSGETPFSDGVRGKGYSSVLELDVRTSKSSSAISDPPEKPPPRTRPDVDALCMQLADAVEANGSKRPNVTKRWRDAARLLLDKDKRTVEQVKACIEWCQSDTFWRANIMSMPTLREKYDQLRLAAQRPAARASPGPHKAYRNPEDPSIYEGGL